MTDLAQLVYQQSVTLNGSGYGFLRFAPAGTDWYVDRIAVKVSTKVLEASVKVYVGPQIADMYYTVGTLTGSTGDTTVGDNIQLFDGSPLWVEWTGGDAGAVATAVIAVRATVPARGFRNAF